MSFFTIESKLQCHRNKLSWEKVTYLAYTSFALSQSLACSKLLYKLLLEVDRKTLLHCMCMLWLYLVITKIRINSYRLSCFVCLDLEVLTFEFWDFWPLRRANWSDSQTPQSNGSGTYLNKSRNLVHLKYPCDHNSNFQYSSSCTAYSVFTFSHLAVTWLILSLVL